jgi:hypothetical protein
MRHIVTFDSSERDLGVWSSPNDFETTFNTPVYNVNEIAVVSAHIPLTQPTVVNGNRVIPIGGASTVFMSNYQFHTDPVALAAHAQSVLAPQLAGITVTYDATYRIFVFARTSAFEFNWESGTYPDGYGPAANILGFTGVDIQATEVTPGNWELHSGVVSLIPVRSIFLRLTHGEDDITEPVLTNPDHGMFFGRLLIDPSQTTLAMRNGDVMIRKLKVNIPTLDSTRIRLYWNNGTRFFPYDTRNANILIKFTMECDHVKIQEIPDQSLQPNDELPPPVEFPMLSTDSEPDRMEPDKFFLYMIGAMLIVGLLLLSGQRRTSAASASSPA